MFRGYVQLPDASGASNPEQQTLALLERDPLTVAFLMESAWQVGGRGGEYLPDGVPLWYSGGFGNALNQLAALAFGRARGQLIWDHLIYAYLIENTRIFEIFHRVLWELAHGERLGIPATRETFRWLRTTEELFYKDASPFQPWSLVSRTRPDIRATRRNAYYRMFGMDLNHGDDSGGYRYEKSAASNRDFVPTLEEFLRQVWIGIEYAPSLVGSNPTDNAAIGNLALRLQNMLLTRRGSNFGGAFLAREEFDCVAAMGWLHLTVQFNTPIVTDLRVIAPSPEERLRLIGERVGVPAHARAHSYFILAPALSGLLTQVEAGLYSNAAAAPNLYAPTDPAGNPNPIREMLMMIITHWSLVTGRDLKAGVVTVTQRPAAPRLEAPAARPAVASGNGQLPTASGAGR